LKPLQNIIGDPFRKTRQRSDLFLTPLPVSGQNLETLQLFAGETGELIVHLGRTRE
jgi:hypothetical protein